MNHSDTSVRRFLCWDESNIAQSENVRLMPHTPTKRNLALVCDDEWEGVHNGYGSLLRVNGTYRFYYRAMAMRHRMDKTMTPGASVICVAESDDGITFRKPILRRFDYNGSSYNNIVFARPESIDNFSVFYDENPNCPADERFKALSDIKRDGHRLLMYYASADGYEFREMYTIDVPGVFDSFNVMLWDASSGLYTLYYRGFHTKEGEDRLNWPHLDGVNDVRDVRRATSADFRHWTVHGLISFAEGQADESLYTNGILRYYRAPDVLLGFPVRYRERAAEKESFLDMPLGDRHEKVTEVFGREGTAVTDCLIMTSRDGIVFDRRDEAFLTPGPESQVSWWYGNCYMAYGLCETPAEEAGADPEISFYVGENYRIKNVNFRRYTLRRDGFFSWFAPYRGGEVLTTPVTVSGDTLSVNFSTSAAGYLSVTLCEPSGEPIPGFEGKRIFGDSTHRVLRFEGDLQSLIGRSVALRITMSDAHLYSYCFE